MSIRGPWRVDLGGDEEPQSVTLHRGQELTLGSGRAALLRIHDPAVSSLHCRLRALDSGIFVEDLASKNGLYVGGARVASALLQESGAAFVVGRSAVSVRTLEHDEHDAPSDPFARRDWQLSAHAARRALGAPARQVSRADPAPRRVGHW